MQADFSAIKQFADQLRAEQASIAMRVEAAVADQQREIQADATAAVGVNTGRLKQSIRPLGKGTRRRVRAGGKRTFYARFQQYGTRKMRARPFLPAKPIGAYSRQFWTRVLTAVRTGRIYR